MLIKIMVCVLVCVNIMFANSILLSSIQSGVASKGTGVSSQQGSMCSVTSCGNVLLISIVDETV